MLESNFIETLSKIHGDTPYLADAEIILNANGFELVSMDSFSEQEDFLTGLPPEIVGRQMAIGACADLLACGARPETLVQSWTYDNQHDLSYYEGVAKDGSEETVLFVLNETADFLIQYFSCISNG